MKKQLIVYIDFISLDIMNFMLYNMILSAEQMTLSNHLIDVYFHFINNTSNESKKKIFMDDWIFVDFINNGRFYFGFLYFYNSRKVSYWALFFNMCTDIFLNKFLLHSYIWLKKKAC